MIKFSSLEVNKESNDKINHPCRTLVMFDEFAPNDSERRFKVDNTAFIILKGIEEDYKVYLSYVPVAGSKSLTVLVGERVYDADYNVNSIFYDRMMQLLKDSSIVF